MSPKHVLIIVRRRLNMVDKEKIQRDGLFSYIQNRNASRFIFGWRWLLHRSINLHFIQFRLGFSNVLLYLGLVLVCFRICAGQFGPFFGFRLDNFFCFGFCLFNGRLSIRICLGDKCRGGLSNIDGRCRSKQNLQNRPTQWRGV